MSNIIQAKKRQLRLKSLGLCQCCGQKPAAVDRTFCRDCLDKKALSARKGTRCRVCNCPLENGKFLCPTHTRGTSAVRKTRIDKYKKAGICIDCGQAPAVPNQVRCPTCRERNRITNHNSYRMLSRGVISLYGGKCVCCGETEPNFLTLDHVNNDGALQRKKINAGSATYKLVMKERPTDIQVLCYNCNCAKGHYGICPHQVARDKEKADTRRECHGEGVSQVQ